MKAHVSFTSLKQLEKFEPQIFAMFKQIKDGERIETADYSYRLRDGGRFGFSVTRFAKDQTTTTTITGGAASTAASVTPKKLDLDFNNLDVIKVIAAALNEYIAIKEEEGR